MYFYTISKIDKNILYKLVDIYANAMDHLDVRKWSIKDFVELINTINQHFSIKRKKIFLSIFFVSNTLCPISDKDLGTLSFASRLL